MNIYNASTGRFSRRGFAVAAVLAAAAVCAQAHICDNVWRQADKLIIKPETSNLVVKDGATFKIFMQSNMDRGIAKNVQLTGTSDAFDVTVRPAEGLHIKPGQQYEYEVDLARKPGVKSGDYALNFNAVVDGRTLRSYTLNASQSGDNAAAQAPAVTRGKLAAGQTPAIDGSVSDECWKSAIMVKTQADQASGVAQPVIMVTTDSNVVYIATSTKLVPDNGTNAVLILVAPQGAGARYRFKVAADGTASVTAVKDGGDQDVAMKEAGISVAAKTWKEAWNAELAIPVSALDAAGPPAGQTWRFNIVRDGASGREETDLWQAAEQVAFPR